MHRWWLALILTACGRVAFDPRPVDSPVDIPIDSAPLHLACNTPVVLAPAPATSSRLSATASTDYVAAAWMDDDGTIEVEPIKVVAPDQITLPGLRKGPPVTASDTVAIVGTPSTVLVAVGGAATPSTEIRVFSTTDGSEIGSPQTTNTGITGPHAVAYLAGSLGASFVLVGTTTGGNSQLVALDANGVPGTTLANGVADPLQSIFDVGGKLALIQQSQPATCQIRFVPYTLAALGTLVTWGGTTCTHPTGAHFAGHNDLALFRHDTTDANINDVIAGIGGAAPTIPGETLLSTTGDEPRAVGVSDGYWVSFAAGGMLSAVHVDFTLSVVAPPPSFTAPMADASSHGIVVVNDNAYVAWVDTQQLWFARLCP